MRLLKLGVLPVKALLAVGECVWASSGGHVFVIDARTHTVEVNNRHTLHILLHGWIRMLKLHSEGLEAKTTDVGTESKVTKQQLEHYDGTCV